MKFLNTPIEGLKIVEPDAFADSRGLFFESYSEREFVNNQIAFPFVHLRICASLKKRD
jgi:dTDP-4-dehydrorhamnose 3,5-epimerase